MNEIERERKYLVRDADNFTELIHRFSIPSKQQIDEHPAIKSYRVQNYNTFTRPYRYFDTFNQDLERQQIFAFIGPADLKKKQQQPTGQLEKKRTTASIRLREEKKDIVITIKYPGKEIDERHQHELAVVEEDFFHFDLNKYTEKWGPLQELKRALGDSPLLEVVRLQVERAYFNLVLDQEWRLQLALDRVDSKSAIGLERRFYELEIEIEEQGTPADKERVASYLEQKCGEALIRSSLPKWIKALQLLRGKEIKPDY